jgi:hypothetical protein
MDINLTSKTKCNGVTVVLWSSFRSDPELLF